jgi:hypothetical protein
MSRPPIDPRRAMRFCRKFPLLFARTVQPRTRTNAIKVEARARSARRGQEKDRAVRSPWGVIVTHLVHCLIAGECLEDNWLHALRSGTRREKRS